MRVFTAEALFLLSLSIYILSALASLLLSKRQKACNILSNILCMAAAAAGLAGSLLHLLSGSGPVTILLLRSAIPLISLHIAMDGLSCFFVMGLSVAAFCISLYSIGYLSHYYGKRNVGLFNFLYSLFILSMALVLTGGNAVFFLVAWEAMSALSYFLVVFESEEEEIGRAGRLYLIMTGIGTAFLLAAFLLMYGYTGTFDLASGSSAIPAAAKHLIFALLFVGLGTKAGVVPLHIWLPAAHPAAPGNVSAMMSGVMIKTAIYALIRFVPGYLGVQSVWWGAALLAVGAVSAVLGVAWALMERNVKRLLAYSSIENIGVILIGAGTSFIAFAQNNAFAASLALTASLFHAFNHTMFKSGLFMGAGAIQFATGTRDIEKLGGLIKRMPATAALTLCFSLAISAIVPFNGFASEWLTFQSLLAGMREGNAGLNILLILAVAALAMSGALAAACFAKLFGIAFLGKPRSRPAADALEVPLSMRVSMGALAAVCLAAGLLPAVFIHAFGGVAASLGGVMLPERPGGGFLTAWVPLAVPENSVTPAGLLVVLAAIALLCLAVVRIAGGKYIERRYGTWDCGFKELTARMQYSATGFSKPLKIVFRILFRPSRELKVSGTAYNPETMEYTVASESIIEKYLYDPLAGFVKRLSNRAKYSIQTGSIRRYLAYILFALIALMLYNLFA